jgi:hypothetical protein
MLMQVAVKDIGQLTDFENLRTCRAFSAMAR